MSLMSLSPLCYDLFCVVFQVGDFFDVQKYLRLVWVLTV